MSDEIDQIEENEAGGKSKKGLFLIIGLVLLLAAGGVGAWFAFSGTEATSEESSSEVASQVAEGSEKGGKVEKSKSAEDKDVPVELSEEPLYVQIGPVVANISMPQKYQYVQATLTLMTYSKGMAEVMPKFEIKIKHILQQSIRDFPEDKLITNDGIEELTKNIKKRLNKFLAGKGLDVKYIDELFLSDVVIE
ncbi:flagellar basal body-associated FliL family protein [Alteromonas macleodii]|uniref:flagellar basal body-associated FliL family protein n=1 Tax=Alteromonas macleodii TaxID=28108 RepID=UPI00313FE66D|tara:strand:+ start:135551 stop:136129 length:579 start_codon:yes stop_codon:yes gene_type:complete